MHSNGRLWAVAVIALVLGIVAGSAAMSIAERGRVTKLQGSLSSVMQRLEASDKQVQDLSDKLNQTPETPPQTQPSTQPPANQPADKRQFGFVKSVTPGAPGKIVVDFATYLTGEAAAKAATKAGEESPPPNDYFIVNEDESPSTLKLAADTVVRLTTRPGEGSVVGGYDTDVATFAGYLSANNEDTAALRADGYWLTVQNGVVTAVEEQYAP
ncbi:MAG TPA: hypothetical protein VFG89_01130 [Coriobacteriia bacterium]|nr:hypothetical protein [Coriobacteriia bacterium]